MPRKGPAVRRETEPDPVYQNVLVTQLIKALETNWESYAARAIQSEMRPPGD